MCIVVVVLVVLVGVVYVFDGLVDVFVMVL